MVTQTPQGTPSSPPHVTPGWPCGCPQPTFRLLDEDPNRGKSLGICSAASSPPQVLKHCCSPWPRKLCQEPSCHSDNYFGLKIFQSGVPTPGRLCTFANASWRLVIFEGQYVHATAEALAGGGDQWRCGPGEGDGAQEVCSTAGENRSSPDGPPAL